MKFIYEKTDVPKTLLSIEEYIPFKIICERTEEAVRSILFSKDINSCLEITFGIKSKLIKRIVLLLCKEYEFLNQKINIQTYDEGDLKIEDGANITTAYFKVYLYTNGIRIMVSEEKRWKYIKLDKLYIGISNINEITEICYLPLNQHEIKHIKDELELQ